MNIRVAAGCGAVLGLVLVAGCGGGSTPDPVTVTVPVPAGGTSAAPPPATQPPAPQGKTVTVPAVVGMNHQKAQDTMQAAGLYNLREEDATGQGRLLLVDRNWVVVTQEPAAGAVVDVGTKVLLRSKKNDDK